MGETRCDGVNVAGYWKGYPCANSGQHEHEGKTYCSVHLAIELKQPGRMAKCAAALAARREREKRSKDD
jgi:hypothetical protein